MTEIASNRTTVSKQEGVSVPPIGLQWLGLNNAQEFIYKTELKGSIHVHEGFGTELCEEDISQSIRQFILESHLYSMRDLGKGRWHKIPTTVLSKEDIYPPLCEVIRSVFAYFKHDANRSVVVTSNRRFYHEGMTDLPGAQTFKSAPDITITGSGNMFSPLAGSGSASYLNCVSAVEVELEDDRVFIRDIIQASVFARQCFLQQHNRKFAYVLAVSESKARLYAFDRAGVCCSMNAIDIHQRPGDFVRLILAASSSNDAAVGFDTDICWEGRDRFLDFIDDKDNFNRYRIQGGRPLTMRSVAIRGRGSCCWEVLDLKGNILIVKDTWSHTDRRPETDFLLRARGLDGVAQIISYEHGLSAWDLRGIDFEEATSAMERSTLHNRIFCRTVLEHGGKSIERFETAEDVLCAMRDAILGHQRLWNKGILHRDISLNNILIGPPGSPSGRRGTLIDLDIAEWVTESLPVANDQVGTRLTQSIHVLKSKTYNGESTSRRKMLHDYLNDLEGFYYGLCYITHAYSGPGRIVRPFPIAIDAWRTNNAEEAATAKLAFIKHNMFIEVQVTPFFGQPFKNLIRNLSKFFWSRNLDKLDFFTLDLATLDSSKRHSIEDYDTVIKFFDEAIAELGLLERASSTSPVLEEAQPEGSMARNMARNFLALPFNAAKESMRTPSLKSTPIFTRQPIVVPPVTIQRIEGKLSLKREMDFEDELCGAPEIKRARNVV